MTDVFLQYPAMRHHAECQVTSSTSESVHTVSPRLRFTLPLVVTLIALPLLTRPLLRTDVAVPAAVTELDRAPEVSLLLLSTTEPTSASTALSPLAPLAPCAGSGMADWESLRWSLARLNAEPTGFPPALHFCSRRRVAKELPKPCETGLNKAHEVGQGRADMEAEAKLGRASAWLQRWVSESSHAEGTTDTCDSHRQRSAYAILRGASEANEGIDDHVTGNEGYRVLDLAGRN